MQIGKNMEILGTELLPPVKYIAFTAWIFVKKSLMWVY